VKMGRMKLCVVVTLLSIALGASAQSRLEFTSGLEATSKLGHKFFAVVDEKSAVAEARKNLAGDPKNPELLLKLAQAQSSVWQDKEAVETLTRAIAISPANGDLYIERGHRELPLRRFEQARADLEKGAQLSPKNMAAYYHLGLAHYFLGEFAASAEAFQKAVATAPNTDERINSTNWLYASLRRAGKADEAKKALEAVPPEMKNEAAHTRFYLNLVRVFQGRMSEADALPPPPPEGNKDPEKELVFDTVAYGIGNWHLYNGDAAKAREYFQKIVKGHVWITWGFVGAEQDLLRKN
ncbi:MAG TPA: tetratricopeptide repeat protein, partial [Bryobacteraceae bacterium]|nr:tetratricopeptide repeat protein [Bryobacteraceae bacterium]